MTENLSHYPRHGYQETHRGTENGYHRVYFTKQLEPAETAPCVLNGSATGGSVTKSIDRAAGTI